MAPPACQRISPQEYLELERASPTRKEYFDGEIYPMPSSSPSHSRICVNCGREIDTRLLDGPCVTFLTQLRMKVAATGLFTYPDVVVVCGPTEFAAEDEDTLVNPTLAVEVLSPSTEAYDRGGKASHYRSIPSLREYVLVSQDRPRLERYTRRGETWELAEFSGLDAQVRLETVPGEIPLARIYDRVALPERSRLR